MISCWANAGKLRRAAAASKVRKQWRMVDLLAYGFTGGTGSEGWRPSCTGLRRSAPRGVLDVDTGMQTVKPQLGFFARHGDPLADGDIAPIGPLFDGGEIHGC